MEGDCWEFWLVADVVSCKVPRLGLADRVRMSSLCQAEGTDRAKAPGW